MNVDQTGCTIEGKSKPVTQKRTVGKIPSPSDWVTISPNQFFSAAAVVVMYTVTKFNRRTSLYESLVQWLAEWLVGCMSSLSLQEVYEQSQSESIELSSQREPNADSARGSREWWWRNDPTTVMSEITLKLLFILHIVLY